MIEEKAKECNIEINQISGIVRWINTKTSTTVKEMEFINPKSDEWFMKYCPTIPDITDSSYIYSLSGWDIVKNSINDVEFRTKWVSTPRYLWYKYDCNKLTKYNWDKYNYDATGVNQILHKTQNTNGNSTLIQWYTGSSYGVTGPATYTHDDGTKESGYEFSIYGVTHQQNYPSTSGSTSAHYYCHSEPNGYSMVNGTFRIDVYTKCAQNYGYMTNQLAKEMYSITVTGYTVSIYKYTLGKKGSYISSVRAYNSTSYPNDGLSGSYWYTYTGTTTEYSRGDYITSLRTTSATSYTNNARNSDGYWYVLQN